MLTLRLLGRLLWIVLMDAAALGSAADLFSKGSLAPGSPGLSTGVTAANGAPAPPGCTLAEMGAPGGNALTLMGVAAQGSFRAADSFVVPLSQQWSIASVTVYAYQPGAVVASPFAGATLRVWRGKPGEPGSVVVVGDATTNRLSIVTPATMFRIASTLGSPAGIIDATRALWKLTLTIPPVPLTAGVYWIDIGLLTVAPEQRGLVAAVVPARPQARHEGAVQSGPGASGEAWMPVLDRRLAPVDSPDAVGLSFLLRGSAAAPCAGFDGLSALLGAYGSTPASPGWNPVCDIDGDGLVGLSDLSLLLAAFRVGCG